MISRAYRAMRATLSPLRARAAMHHQVRCTPALWVSFRGIEVYVAPGCAIPNKAGSVFVDYLVPLIRERHASTLLEMGTGSGAIGLACKAETALRAVDLVDISPYAVRSVRQTLHRYPDEQVGVILSDGLRDVPAKRYDLIVSNPPHGDAPAYTVYHRGGNDPGWSLHRQLFREAHRFLTQTGRLVLFENGAPGFSTPETFTPMLAESPLMVEQIVELPATDYPWYVLVLAPKTQGMDRPRAQ